MRQAAVATLYGAGAGMIAAVVLGAMNALTAVLWHGELSWGRTFATIMVGGVLIAGLRMVDGGKEDDLAAQLRAARDPSAFHWRRSALLAAMAIVAVAFGGAIGPEAGTLAVVAELSAIVSLAIARSSADRAFIGEVGAAAALGGIYGSPPGATVLAEEGEPDPERATDSRGRQVLLFLAAVAGLAGFALVAKLLLPGGGMRVHLPSSDAPDELRDLLTAIVPALLGGLAGLGFVVLLPRLQHLLTRCGGPVVQTLLCTLAFAVVAASFPILRFSGHHEMEAMLAWGASVGMPALLALAGLKMLCLALCLAGGWRGGAIFPLIFIGAAAGSSVLGLVPSLDPTVAILAGISAAATVGMGKPLAAILIVALLVGPLVASALCVGALVGFMFTRIHPVEALH